MVQRQPPVRGAPRGQGGVSEGSARPRSSRASGGEDASGPRSAWAPEPALPGEARPRGRGAGEGAVLPSASPLPPPPHPEVARPPARSAPPRLRPCARRGSRLSPGADQPPRGPRAQPLSGGPTSGLRAESRRRSGGLGMLRSQGWLAPGSSRKRLHSGGGGGDFGES